MQLWDNPNKGKKTKERWKKYDFAPFFPPSPLQQQMEFLAAAAQMFICVFSLVIGGF